MQMRNHKTHLKKCLPEEPPDEKIVEREQKKLLTSEYQVSYGKDLGKFCFICYSSLSIFIAPIVIF